MEWSGWIAIVVAFLGIAGGIWTQIIQFKKDARQIDNLKSDVGNVKVDTGTMLPTLQYTDENVKKSEIMLWKKYIQLFPPCKTVLKKVLHSSNA